ncbi:uncharacterized protein TNCV_1264581, partial [Trichonephila clavipes]
DSRSALRPLSGWSSANDETSVFVLLKLMKISQTHDVHLHHGSYHMLTLEVMRSLIDWPKRIDPSESQILPLIFCSLGKYVFGVSQALRPPRVLPPPRGRSCEGVRYAIAMYMHTLQDVLFNSYKQSTDNARSFAFSQRTDSPRLIKNETFNGRDVINNLMDYEDGEEEPDSLRVDKNMQGSNKLENLQKGSPDIESLSRVHSSLDFATESLRYSIISHEFVGFRLLFHRAVADSKLLVPKSKLKVYRWFPMVTHCLFLLCLSAPQSTRSLSAHGGSSPPEALSPQIRGKPKSPFYRRPFSSLGHSGNRGQNFRPTIYATFSQ